MVGGDGTSQVMQDLIPQEINLFLANARSEAAAAPSPEAAKSARELLFGDRRKSGLFGPVKTGSEELFGEERDVVVEDFNGLDFSTMDTDISDSEDGYGTHSSNSDALKSRLSVTKSMYNTWDRFGQRAAPQGFGRTMEASRGSSRRHESNHFSKDNHVHLIFSLGVKTNVLETLTSDTLPLGSDTVVGDSYRSFPSLKACLRFVQRRLTKGLPLHPYWIDITGLEQEDARILQDVYDVHPLTIEDMLHHESAEKCECYHYYFIALRLFRMIDDDPMDLDCRTIVPYYFILFDNVAITVHGKDAAGWRDVIDRVLNDRRIVQHTSWILYSALDTLIDLLQDPVTSMSEEAYAIDELSFELGHHEYKDFLSRLKRGRKMFAELKRSLSPKRNLITYIISKHSTFLHPDVQLYFRDVLDHVARDMERLDFSHDLLNQAQTNFNSNAQWELNESQKSVDDSMRKLALVNVAFLPLTVITGMWGMNVQVPGEDVENGYWFLGISLVLLVMLVGLYFVFNLPCLWGRPNRPSKR